MEQAIDEILAREDASVAPAPGIALRIASLLDERDFSTCELVRLAWSDPGVASKVLAAAGERGKETPASMHDAIEGIGERALLGIARRVARCAGAAAAGPFATLRSVAWRGAISSAMVSRGLARARGLDAEAAWLCGLLHDVGRVVAIAAVEKLCAGARAAAGTAARCEGLVERWHVSLGLSTAARLRFPRAVKDAIARHHAARLDPNRSPELVRVVRSADAIARIVWERPGEVGDDAAMAELTNLEAERVAPMIAGLRPAVAALERVPHRGSRLATAAGGLRGTFHLHESKGPGVRLRIAGREYAAVGIAPHLLHVAGPAPLGESALLEVEVIERSGLVFHARVLLGWPEGDRFGAILMPFALGGRMPVEWSGCVPVGANA